MATRSAIDRLTRRIDAIAGRRWGRFTLESLTDEAWLKIERLAGPRIGPCRQTTGAEHWSTDVLRFLVESGDLTAADFKGDTNGDANGGSRDALRRRLTFDCIEEKGHGHASDNRPLAERVDGLADRLGLSFSAFLDSMSDAELGRTIAAVKASIAGESIDAESQATIADLSVRMRALGAG